MKRLRSWIAGGAVLAIVGLLFLITPRFGGFGLIAVALAAVGIVAFRVL